MDFCEAEMAAHQGRRARRPEVRDRTDPSGPQREALRVRNDKPKGNVYYHHQNDTKFSSRATTLSLYYASLRLVAWDTFDIKGSSLLRDTNTVQPRRGQEIGIAPSP